MLACRIGASYCICKLTPVQSALHFYQIFTLGMFFASSMTLNSAIFWCAFINLTNFYHFCSANLFTIMDCATLAVIFPGRVAFQNTEAYANTTTSYWSAFENELKPACVVTPKTAKELGKVIKHIGALPGNFEVAIKGGGHTAWAGSANTDGGILINLKDFNEMQINQQAGTITIGVGHNWGDVYELLQPHALAVAGGRVSNVGVSGLILGGMYIASQDH